MITKMPGYEAVQTLATAGNLYHSYWGKEKGRRRWWNLSPEIGVTSGAVFEEARTREKQPLLGYFPHVGVGVGDLRFLSFSLPPVPCEYLLLARSSQKPETRDAGNEVFRVRPLWGRKPCLISILGAQSGLGKSMNGSESKQA